MLPYCAIIIITTIIIISPKGGKKDCPSVKLSPEPADSEAVSPSQECEDLRKENKFLANEIHMERITMRTENELIMRNLRNLNQELQADIKEVGCRLSQDLAGC